MGEVDTVDTKQARLSLGSIESLRPKVSLEPAYVRAWLEHLGGKTVVFFNNGKMSPEYVVYRDFYPVVADLFQTLQVTCHLVTRHMLSEYDEAIEGQLLGEIRSHRPDGVVVGIGDAGATYRTCLLTRRLIKEGLPCVMVCNDLGIRLAQTMASRSMPNLPIVRIPARSARLTADVLRALSSEIADRLRTGPSPAETTGERDWARYQQLTVEGELHAADGDGGVTFRPTSTRSDFSEALLDLLSEDRLGDGLPVVVPTVEKVSRMLGGSPEPPETIVAPSVGPVFANVTVKDIAVNAVLAGCTPDCFPIVLAAFKAMAQERYALSWASITTHPSGNMVLVSGPLADEVGVASGMACLGPGFRSNATIGRAISLTVINTVGAVPGKGTLSVLGSPAQYSYCFAENIAESPWPGLHEDLCDKDSTIVVAHRVEGPRNVLEHLAKEPELILETVARSATSPGSNNAYFPAELIVILNPEHAWLIADRGWPKADVQRYLYEKIRNKKQDLLGRGVLASRPKWMSALADIPVVERPEDIWVVVAGGWGPQSMVAVPWGWSRLCWERVTAPASGRVR
ncbi:MAG: hypothetical protein HYV93_15330 [Candidatus Rokubacteria bacterium]|nr:hypothetical protein [Candidatus Rokubacteria bacterium]